MDDPQHPLASLILARWAEPSRTGSLIITLFGDAIAPRGGEMALAAILHLFAGLDIAPGVVRTAISRLHDEGWLEANKVGRASFYRLTNRSRVEFAEASLRIYGPLDRPWDGRLRLAFPAQGADRTALETAGFAILAPGVLAAPDGEPAEPHLVASGSPATIRALALRAWPVAKIAVHYATLIDRFQPLETGAHAFAPAEAMAARTLLIHDYRRIVLRDPRLPAGLLPDPWPGYEARKLAARLYAALAPASEAWLDRVQTRSGPLKGGPDPKYRFTDPFPCPSV